MYSSRGRSGVAEKMREILEDLLEKYQVDVAFWGHVHNYGKLLCTVTARTKGDRTQNGC